MEKEFVSLEESFHSRVGCDLEIIKFCNTKKTKTCPVIAITPKKFDSFSNFYKHVAWVKIWN